jgi:hypothetical protein
MVVETFSYRQKATNKGQSYIAQNLTVRVDCTVSQPQVFGPSYDEGTFLVLL